ncbi:MAG: hypothetical protein ACR2IV_17515 [Bryobacteraceae bacterium]
MAKNNNPRNLPAVSQQHQVMNPPRKLALGSAQQWINEQTEQKGAEITQHGALGAYAVQVNTAMTVANADSTVKGMHAIEGMRPQDGSPKFVKLADRTMDAFQADLIDSNRIITAEANANISATVRHPFEQPEEEERSGWDKLWNGNRK